MTAHSLCVLLAEDELVNQTLLRHMLESLGHSVVLADHGAQALELVATRDGVDVVLMDMQMPVMDGETATRLIRMLPGNRARLPVVALTADNDRDTRERCLSAGMTAVLGKPVNASRLDSVLRQVAGTAPPAAAEATDGGPSALPVLDPAYLDDMRQWVGDSTVLALLAAAPQSFRDELTQITEAWQARNLRGVRENAHRLKGAAGSVGCRRLADTAQSIQKSGDADLGDPCLLQRLNTDVDAAIAATTAWQPPP